MPKVTRDDVTLFYLDEGQGNPVLLIHGHTLDHRVWDWTASGLLENGLRLIRPDLRGHGRSTRPNSGYHWCDHAADMSCVLDAAGLDRVAVVGYSLGGGVALEMALTMPERVNGLALLSPVLPDRPFEEAFFTNLREVAKVIRSDGVAAAMRGPWLESPLWSGCDLEPRVRQKLDDIVRDFPGAEYLATERDRVERDWIMPGRLGEIEVPTLVMVGEHEMAGFRGFADEIAAGIPRAQLDVLPDLGHVHLLQAPELIAKRVVEQFTT